MYVQGSTYPLTVKYVCKFSNDLFISRKAITDYLFVKILPDQFRSVGYNNGLISIHNIDLFLINKITLIYMRVQDQFQTMMKDILKQISLESDNNQSVYVIASVIRNRRRYDNLSLMVDTFFYPNIDTSCLMVVIFRITKTFPESPVISGCNKFSFLIVD